MIGWLMRKRIRKFEQDFDYDMSYAREMFEASPRAFFRFARVSGLAAHREGVPIEAWYAAKLVATLSEDCGPCTQLVVTMAERDGVNPATLRAIVAGDEAAISADAALGFHFAKTVLERDLAEGERLRREVVGRWGRKALVSLALTIAASRIFPTVKYALGHGQACSRVRVGGAETQASRAAGSL
jgi:hypothetical protein